MAKITEIKLELTIKYSNDVINAVIEHLAKSCTINNSTSATLSFRLLNACGTSMKIADKNLIRFKEDDVDKSISVLQIKQSLASVDKTLTLRGYCKALSIILEPAIREDIKAIESGANHNDDALNFPKAALSRKLYKKVNSEVDRYYLSDAFDNQFYTDAARRAIKDYEDIEV